jgi:hypothetical protein
MRARSTPDHKHDGHTHERWPHAALAAISELLSTKLADGVDLKADPCVRIRHCSKGATKVLASTLGLQCSGFLVLFRVSYPVYPVWGVLSCLSCLGCLILGVLAEGGGVGGQPTNYSSRTPTLNLNTTLKSWEPKQDLPNTTLEPGKPKQNPPRDLNKGLGPQKPEPPKNCPANQRALVLLQEAQQRAADVEQQLLRERAAAAAAAAAAEASLRDVAAEADQRVAYAEAEMLATHVKLLELQEEAAARGGDAGRGNMLVRCWQGLGFFAY